MIKKNITYNKQKLIELINRDKRTNIEIGRIVKQHPNMVGKIARGDSLPSVESLARYAELYGKDVNYFYDLETKTEVEPLSIKITDVDRDYLADRLEKMAGKNAILENEVERLNNRVKELEGIKKYTMSDVPVGKVAETPIELKKKQL